MKDPQGRVHRVDSRGLHAFRSSSTETSEKGWMDRPSAAREREARGNASEGDTVKRNSTIPRTENEIRKTRARDQCPLIVDISSKYILGRSVQILVP